MRLEQIDGSFRPRGRQAVEAVVIDGRAVLYDGDTADLVELDETATRLWQCFDGRSTIDELARDLARATDADRATIGQDIVDFCKDLSCSGLLEDVTLAPPVRLPSADVSVAPASGPDDGVPLDQIDLRFVARPGPAVVTREVGGRSVLLDVESGAVCALDAVGSVVWRCFDGLGDLGELVDELASVSGAPRREVAGDVIDLTVDLAALGMLDGVAPPGRSAGADPGLPLGSAFPDTAWVDLDGGVADPGVLGSGSVLVVAWSATCGYCAAIASQLADLEGPLAEARTRLVLVASGDRGPNRDLATASGLRGPILVPAPVDHDGIDPLEALDQAFAHAGTPVAYLLDDATVASALAVGGDEVLALARDRVGPAGEPVGTDGVRYRHRASGGVCASTGAARPRAWAETVTCRVGDHHVGIRADTAGAAALVRRGLVGWAVDPDPRVPPNYSVVLGGSEDPGSGRQLCLLLEDDEAVVRSRSARRVLDALAAHLWWWLHAEDPRYLRTRNLAIVADDRAILLPPALGSARDRLQPRLARLGYRFVDQPRTLVDVGRAELVVPSPSITISSAVRAELVDPPASRFEQAPARPGRYPLSAWTTLVDDGRDDPEGSPADPTAAALLADALHTVEVAPRQLDAAADAVLDLFARVEVVALRSARTGGLVEQLVAAVPAPGP